MAENIENTLTAYLGPEFQQKLLWQLLVEPEFAEKTIENLAVEYFDDPNIKRLFIIMLEYYNEYGKVPNLQNQSVQQAINKFKTPHNIIEEETLFSVIKRIDNWNERVMNKEMLHDGDIIQKATNGFIKQQEYRKLGEFIITKTKNGEIKNKHTLGSIEEKIDKISHIGDDEDYGTEVIDGIDRALRKEFRETIPTGVRVIDMLTGGGLGKGEIGIVLTPSGVGKTTLLTKIANTAYELNKNVLQIIFEDTEDQIKRKHYTIWSKTPLSGIDDNVDFVKKTAYNKADAMRGKGHLIIKEFSQEDTTMMDIKNWVLHYQKKWGYKFDIIVLDYLDCLDSHKRTNNINEAELVIIKSFEAMSSDFNIPMWTAIQSNRSGFDAEFVEAHQSGGNIKRIQKAHFFMSVAKTPSQKESNLANIRIIKARFAADGQTFIDAYFNNDTMEIRIEDDRYPIKHTLKKHDDSDVDKVLNQAEGLRLKDDAIAPNVKFHGKICKHTEEDLIKKVNDDAVNDGEGINEGINEGIIKIPETPPDEGLIEIDESPEAEKIPEIIENDAVSDGVNDGVKNEGLLDFTGETTTVSENVSEVKPTIIFETELKTKAQLDEVKPPTQKNNRDVDDLEKSFLDPDEVQGNGANIRNTLDKLRVSQANKK